MVIVLCLKVITDVPAGDGASIFSSEMYSYKGEEEVRLHMPALLSVLSSCINWGSFESNRLSSSTKKQTKKSIRGRQLKL